MELPDDVLQLVRAYAKPWFKHYNEYKRILSILCIRPEIDLRICLQYHPDQILPILDVLENAHAEYLVALDEYMGEHGTYKKQYDFYMKRGIFSERQLQVTRMIHMLCRMNKRKIRKRKIR
jgi:hypothetical protein